MQRLPLLALPAILLTRATASAHAGIAPDPSSFVVGLADPILGPVHLVAMIAIGVFAAMSGETARWAYPASYLGGMVAGSALGPTLAPVSPIGLASIALLGAGLIALAWRLWSGSACAALACFGVAHGCSHGCESLPVGRLPFVAGFVLTASVLMGIGLVLGFAIGRPSRPGVASSLSAFACLAALALAIG